MWKTNKVLLSVIVLVWVVGIAGLTYAASGDALKDFRGRWWMNSLIWSWSNFWFMMWKKWMDWKMWWRHWWCEKMWWMVDWKNDWFWMNEKLTDSEKEKLKTMSETERQSFFENKRKEFQAKRESREAVIDKLVNWEVLTDVDKKIIEEIKIDRAEVKKQRSEMELKMKEQKAKMTEIQPLLEKVKKWETLTAEEKAKLYDTMSKMKWSWKWKNWN